MSVASLISLRAAPFKALFEGATAAFHVSLEMAVSEKAEGDMKSEHPKIPVAAKI